VRGLLDQWDRLGLVISTLDLDRPTRLDGWRNRELLAHLTIQPALLRRFLENTSTEPPVVGLVENLRGTAKLAEVIDIAAHEKAMAMDVDFAAAVEKVRPDLTTADLALTIVSLQGPILLEDYLVTRCVEAVVHGLDFVPSVEPNALAESIVHDALLDVLAATAPALVADARRLPQRQWIEAATGRRQAPPGLAAAVPLMT
jgi:hypothetical protein